MNSDMYKNNVEIAKTYVNPTPLPDMPQGRLSRLEKGGKVSWREAADPTVLFENGKWYLFSSCGMAWVSEDFCTWRHEKIEPYDIGYAPTVVRHGDKYYLCACNSPLYVSDGVLGKYSLLGTFKDKEGVPIGDFYDPMLFSDSDGSLYLYYCIYEHEFHSTSIYGVKLKSGDPCRFDGDTVRLIVFNPDHIWERNGEHNEDASTSAVEGPWMYKHGSTYYLIYTAPGTEYSTYALGAYKSGSPLSGFEYMETSPFTLKKHGVVKGAGHGCITDGPNGTAWVFYTCHISSKHKFERMIGYDRITFNSNGDIICEEVTDTPQISPAESTQIPHYLPLTASRNVVSSSSAAGRDAVYAVSDDLTSWWEPLPNDTTPTLDISLPPLGAYVSSLRIIWNEIGIKPDGSNANEPIPYKLELKLTDGSFKTVVDKTYANTVLPVDYVPIPETFALSARLTVFRQNLSLIPAIYNITLFGR